LIRNRRSLLAILPALLAVLTVSVRADDEAPPTGATPPRVSYTEGEVSFQRSGVADWTPVQINTPLAVGDALYTGSDANLEIQIGERAFVRAGEQTYLSLGDQEPDFFQLRVTGGRVSVDLRSLPPGKTLEIGAPNAVFTLSTLGYFRLEVSEGRTEFVSRRGGQATVTLADGKSDTIMPSEEVVIRGTVAPAIETYAAPEPDAWDSWNFARTDRQIDAVSNRYLPSGVYGGDALDQYGSWRSVPTYGQVWVPDRLPGGWVPYSTGSWIWDPYYRWTWVDHMPWGWAPFHYGRWVFVDRFWAWAPGPIVRRPYYAPALVAFFSGAFRIDSLCWVALSWGEPLVPWWGPPGFVGLPWWGGWGGPRIIHNVVHIKNVRVFRNVHVPHAVVGVPLRRFGHHSVPAARVTRVDPARLTRAPETTLPKGPVRAPGYAGAGYGPRPPAAIRERPVFATRPSPPTGTVPPPESAKAGRGDGTVRLVPPPRPTAGQVLDRPPFGMEKGQERPRPEAPPRFRPKEPPTQPPIATPRRGTRPQASPSRGAPAIPAGPTVPEATPSRPTTPRTKAGIAEDRFRRRVTPGVQTLPRQTTPQVPERIFRPPAAPRAAEDRFRRRVTPEVQPLPRQTTPQIPERIFRPSVPQVERLPRQTVPRERAPVPGRSLPGEPASRMFPGSRIQTPPLTAPQFPRAVPGARMTAPAVPRSMGGQSPRGGRGGGGRR
jgi:hypothetical protein